MTAPVRITFITPCFCRGADCSDSGAPEIRPASIRGQLHWWFRALGGKAVDEDIVFGNIRKNTAASSKLVVRVRMTGQRVLDSPTLPHKFGGRAAPKKAFAPGTSFELLLSWRRGGVWKELREQFDHALAAWLHMGALGLRATRGGGNFCWEGQPPDAEQYAESVRSLTEGSSISVDLLSGKIFENAESARRVITNTLAEEAFGNAERPLGGIKRPGRKTSPLRFRVVQLGGSDFRILVVWDGRFAVTGNKKEDLQFAVDKLARRDREEDRVLGVLLRESELLKCQ